jgi:hypothetical protein
MFNMMARDRYGNNSRVVVNSCNTNPYVIPTTYPSINYVPFSTSGALVGGGQPQANNFIDNNQLLLTDASGGITDLFDGVTTPGGHGDLIAYLNAASIALFDQAGNFLAGYEPSAAWIVDETEEADLRGTDAGTVYIFNIFSEDISVTSNGAAVGDIPAWSSGSGASPIYTPSVLLARRVLNASQGPGNIANGSNAMAITSLEGLSLFTLPVDGNRFPLNQSLLLFIARNHWRLTNQFGVVAAEGVLSPPLSAGQSDPTAITTEENMSAEHLNTAAGNVYVFNVTSQDLNLSTNGMSTSGGTISGWTQSGTNKYQPNVQAVPRVLNASDSPGKFFNGTNNLALSWIDGLFMAVVKIDGTQIPLNQDLLLFIERNKWQLVNQYAVEVANGDVTAMSVLREGLELALAAQD